MNNDQIEELEATLIERLLGCALGSFSWADGQQDGTDLLDSFHKTAKGIERWLHRGKKRPHQLKWS